MLVLDGKSLEDTERVYVNLRALTSITAPCSMNKDFLLGCVCVCVCVCVDKNKGKHSD